MLDPADPSASNPGTVGRSISGMEGTSGMEGISGNDISGSDGSASTAPWPSPLAPAKAELALFEKSSPALSIGSVQVRPESSYRAAIKLNDYLLHCTRTPIDNTNLNSQSGTTVLILHHEYRTEKCLNNACTTLDASANSLDLYSKLRTLLIE